MSSVTLQGTPAPTIIPNTTKLMAVDRCDSGACFAQAYVRVTLASGLELLFCKHDYEKQESALATVALHVHDERAELLPKPYNPATDNS